LLQERSSGLLWVLLHHALSNRMPLSPE
jgi:hypothetical protein